MRTSLYLFLYALAIVIMGYFLPRENFGGLAGMYGLAFGMYYLICKSAKNEGFSIGFGIAMALVLRLLLFGATPELSDDFYRFVFDGQLLKLGVNPYLNLPEEAFGLLGIPANGYWQSLLEQMNSSQYYSVYPPLHQLFFWWAALPGENLIWNVLVLRGLILIFEGLNIFLILRILQDWKLPTTRIWLYAFNPLVIMECTGNLHFEGIVLTGLLLAVYGWGKMKAGLSAFGWSWAVGIKLSPLMFGPIWLMAWPRKKGFVFLLLAAIAIGFFVAPLAIGDSGKGFWQSIRLYQSSFEFNASLYYLLREVFSFFLGYNPIGTLGPILNLLLALGILVFSFFWKIEKKESLAEGMVWILLIYLLFQTVVHPWYLIPAVGLSVLTKNRIFLVWSCLVFLSYSAYGNRDFVENPYLLLFEYGALLAFIYWNYLRRFVSSKKV
ncbi:carotene biosynthesis protein [Rhodonellum sp.]|uniref:carotene biosynthesis protein n=1 Tax=Rhodonellum sp. TaxID=2231180 RepID=UPI0027176BED|nr:carotene biosynthesis protein [Rhodonellum sp.]MDO9554500.1 carotene biosynthesis protein [Rhodonellum sp.]